MLDKGAVLDPHPFCAEPYPDPALNLSADPDPDPGLAKQSFGHINYEYINISHIFIAQGEETICLIF